MYPVQAFGKRSATMRQLETGYAHVLNFLYTNVLEQAMVISAFFTAYHPQTSCNFSFTALYTMHITSYH
jgi:hypothetical protein